MSGQSQGSGTEVTLGMQSLGHHGHRLPPWHPGEVTPRGGDTQGRWHWEYRACCAWDTMSTSHHHGTHVIPQDPCDKPRDHFPEDGAVCPSRGDRPPSLQGDFSPRGAAAFPHPGGFRVTGAAPAKAAGWEHHGFVFGAGL